jgi:hypothetical protein
MLERRWERRLLCADLVQIEWTDSAGKTCNTTAILEDISRAGACLQADVPMPVNALVQIRRGKTLLEGTITYCAFRDIGYFAGLTFIDNQHWSQRMFRPKHLVDPVELETITEVDRG